MRALVPCFFSAAVLLACSPAPAPASPPTPAPTDASSTATSSDAGTTPAGRTFAQVSAQFLDGYLKRNPTAASGAGNHAYDGKWPDVSEEGDRELLAFLDATRADLASVPASAMDEQDRVDAKILETQLDYMKFKTTDLRAADKNPLTYTTVIGDGIDVLIARDFAPHADRMRSLKSRLEGIPAIVAVGKKRLAHPPRLFTETAIQQNKGLIDVCAKGLVEDFAKEPDQKAQLESAAKSALAALRDFQTFLEKDLLARSDGDFRVGKDVLEKTMRFELDDDVSADTLAREAKELIAKTQEEMVDTAMELAPTLLKGKPAARPTTTEGKKKLVKAALDALAADRPDNKTILADAKKELDRATAFVKEHDLVRLPEDPCQVIEMPEYRRGVTVAYCDSSGPLEEKAWSVYAISPTPAGWPAKRAESFYREYNHSMLVDLTVHEAMPGHYLQAMHANKTHRPLRALFSSGPFVEGWAVYGEWLMAKYGFGGPKVRLERQKMILRVAANAVLDHGIHAGKMTEKEATALMTEETFQEEGEAVGKWNRARLTFAQLSTYYYGFTELMKLRVSLEKTPGFTERAYHDRLLSYGSPSIRHVRALMTKSGN